MIEAKIIADSYNPAGDRLTTYLLRYPRFFHADFMTHRVFSRNASSSRARPAIHFIQEAEQTPALPIYWGKNQKGMQAREELFGEKLALAQQIWDEARQDAIKHAKRLNEVGLHKQLLNRILEPFTHITVICTATDYGNFFNLRAHEDAMPELEELAFQMAELYVTNQPKHLNVGDWHLPFCDNYIEKHDTNTLLKICTARCARVSYLNFEGNIDYTKDCELHDDLKKSGHWSPFEHAAIALDKSDRCGNLIGWKQYRKFFLGENQTKFNAVEKLGRRKRKHAKENS